MEVWIPIISILISVSASVIITNFQRKTEIDKLRKQLEQQYAKSLFDKRLGSYPKLYKILSGFDKNIKHNKQTCENLRQFRDNIDIWDSENAILLTESTARLAGKCRRLLDIVLIIGNKSKVIEEKTYNYIFKLINWWETALKTEIGVIDTLPPGNMKKRLEEVYDDVDNNRKRLKDGLQVEDKLPELYS